MNMDYINKKLQEMLSEHRYQHSLGTAIEAKKLAERYHSDQDKAYLAGLLHDCAKSLSKEQMKELLNDEGYSEEFLSCKTVMHAPAGEKLAEREFEITDADILHSIRYHCYGKEDMSLLEKIIYVADKIEPSRQYNGIDELRKLAYENLDKALLVFISHSIKTLTEQNRYLYENTIRAKKYYDDMVENKGKL
ncbi:MAG: bis(5'-nucleosyl)-tetraphosphatase (symmetrical) YqeK [Clostridia bacterium]|nr:bis(5'-nucleosyl)-tetraphosphatase (symmetrical) YqeK [Clostridia bacterium]